MEKKKKRPVSVIAMACFLITGSFGLLGNSYAQSKGLPDEIKLAVVGPMSGPVADSGLGYKNASNMAVDEINAKGGILGKKIKLIFGDTESKPSSGVAVAERLINRDKVDIITGEIHTDVGLATMEVTAKYGMPYVMSGPASQTITDKIRNNLHKYRHIYKMDPSTRTTGEQHSVFLAAMEEKGIFKPKTKRLAIIGENTDYGRTMCEYLKESAAKNGIETVAFELVDMKQADFMSILNKIKKMDPDYMFSVQAALSGGVSLAKQFREIGIPVLCYMGFYAAGKEEFLELAGSNADGMVTAFIGTGMITGDYAEKYKKRFGIAAEIVSPFQYDAIYLTAGALKRANTTDPEKFAEAFGQSDYKGVHGRWVFNKDDHEAKVGPDYLPYIFRQSWGGKRYIVWPFNIPGVQQYRTPSWLTK